MQHAAELFARVALLAGMCLLFWQASVARLSSVVNLCVIFLGVLLTFPLIWLARRALDRHQSAGRAVWMTMLVHCGLGFTFGVPIVRAIVTHDDWSGWVLPVPPRVGAALVKITLAASAIVVANLAVKGLGAPGIALSRKLASDWLYAWTRNPMVLAALAFFLALGIWFRSTLFLLWVVVPLTPALLFFVKVYEERELELRFGAPYLEYKARTPMLWPRRPSVGSGSAGRGG